MADPEKTKQNILAPLVVVVAAMVCLVLVLGVSLVRRTVDTTLAFSILVAVGLLITGGSVILYTRRFSTLPVIALVAGLLFYASSVFRYTFGVITQRFSITSLVTFNYQTQSNQVTHGAGMAILGLGIIFVAARAIVKSPARSHAEQVMAYILFGLGVIQVIIGVFALLI